MNFSERSSRRAHVPNLPDWPVSARVNGRSRLGLLFALLLSTAVNAQTTVQPFDASIAIGCGTVNYPSAVFAAAEQPDGRIVIAGCFQSVGGQTRINVARLLADGTLDSTLDPRPNGPVFTVVITADERILIAGDFTTVTPGGIGTPVSRRGMARLLPNGDLDPGFDPSFYGPSNNANLVRAIEYFDDDRILVGGNFHALQPNQAPAPTARFALARLILADGSLDSSLDASLDSLVYTIQRQPTGGFLIGGVFQNFRQAPASQAVVRHHLLKLDAAAQLDPGFTAAPNNHVWTIATDFEQRLLIGGKFSAIAPSPGGTLTARSQLLRLNAAGVLDPDFQPNPRHLPGGEAGVYAIQPAADSSLRIAGIFDQVDRPSPLLPAARSRFARLLADGSLSSGFNPFAELSAGSVLAGYSLLPQRAGPTVITGTFTQLRPDQGNTIELRNLMAAVATPANGRTIDILSTDSVCLNWQPQAILPHRVWFETSTDGTNWTDLGSANFSERQRACSLGRSLIGATLVRVRAHDRTGVFNNSLSLFSLSAEVQFADLPSIFRDGFE